MKTILIVLLFLLWIFVCKEVFKLDDQGMFIAVWSYTAGFIAFGAIDLVGK